TAPSPSAVPPPSWPPPPPAPDAPAMPPAPAAPPTPSPPFIPAAPSGGATADDVVPQPRSSSASAAQVSARFIATLLLLRLSDPVEAQPCGGRVGHRPRHVLIRLQRFPAQHEEHVRVGARAAV